MQREEFMRGLQVLISNVSDQSTRNLLAKELETALKSLRQENPNIKANRQRFSRDLSQGVHQLYMLERKLEGQDGTFSKWTRAVYEVNEDFEQPFSEAVNDLCQAFSDVNQKYGQAIACQLYNTMAVILPSEIRNAAQFLNFGGNIAYVPALAEVGFLMDAVDDGAAERTAAYMNAGGDAAYAWCVAKEETISAATESDDPQIQQTMQ